MRRRVFLSSVWFLVWGLVVTAGRSVRAHVARGLAKARSRRRPIVDGPVYALAIMGPRNLHDLWIKARPWRRDGTGVRVSLDLWPAGRHVRERVRRIKDRWGWIGPTHVLLLAHPQRPGPERSPFSISIPSTTNRSRDRKYSAELNPNSRDRGQSPGEDGAC